MNIENNFLTNLSLSIRFCHYLKKDTDWSEQKTKTAYTFWCVQEGAFTLKINHRLYTVSAGDTVFFYPGARYRAYANGEKCSFLYISFSLEAGNHIDLLEGNNYFGIYRHPAVSEAARRFCQSNVNKSDNLNSIAFLQYMAFMNFFSVIAPYFGKQEYFYEEAITPADMRIHRVIGYIHEFYAKPLTNAELAAYIGMSEKYFINFFRKQTSISPMQYLHNYRMQQAMVLLTDPSNSIADIAQQLNFTDQFSFSKAFKRYYGESPSAFKKQLIW